MKHFIMAVMLALAVGCGKDASIPKTSDAPSPSPTPVKCGDNRGDGYQVVGCLEITVSKNEDAASIVYVSAVNENFSIDENDLVVTLSGDENTLDLGTITVTNAKTNKTKICGVGGNETCTSAIIRVFTEELVGYTGIEGFVNKTDSYGVPVKVTDSDSVKQTVGLAVANAVSADTIDITGKRKISSGDWNSSSFPLEVDFSNAGYGNYEMTITVEMALGN